MNVADREAFEKWNDSVGFKPSEAEHLQLYELGLSRGREEMENGWISVKERLPDEPQYSQRYLCWLSDARGHIGYWKIVWYHNFPYEPELTHWMLLPSPPKPEDSEVRG